jgi:predicted unusual protein kinase regulating ubiquinone biosynthesis (AarF/ABC1/UbiB family)
VVLAALAGVGNGEESGKTRGATTSRDGDGETRVEAPVAVPEGLPSLYDVEGIRAYWKTRPLASFKRTGSLVTKVTAWGFGLVSDIVSGPETVKKNSRKRARLLKDLIAAQGPAFVKVGQAVAIRPDLLPPAYLEELQTLLDQVAPFGSDEARALIRQQLGRSGNGDAIELEDVFEDVSAFDRPVAAASIGQVYRAKLKKGGFGVDSSEYAEFFEMCGAEVAVKVQRPCILETVTLDLLVIRSILHAAASLEARGISVLEQIKQGAEGLLPVLDVAAERFLEELDYGLEADNASRFEKDMRSVEVVRGAVKVPHVFRGLSGRCVLTQEWVEGKKLTDITDDPTTGPLRAKLVQTLLNSYMVQFLETGFLHADPHPGNFLLMPDGRLCILDYGMMTEITEDQRVAFIEYIAHLSARDYEKTLTDLVNLGFVPPELANDPVNRNVVVPALAETLETLYGSGGSAAKKLDKLSAQGESRVAELSDTLERLTKEYPLRLPPYFGLILLAFGTLEGLGLSVDENYAIVDECFPYVARRMLADDSPRMRSALRSFVYGGSDRLKVARVRSVAAGFSDFTNNMDAGVAAEASESGSSNPKDGAASKRIDAATRDALALVFSAEGNYLQEILVEEAVRAADSLSRNAASGAWRVLGNSAPLALGLGLLAPPLALAPGVNLPIVLSLLASRNKGTIVLTLDDKRNLALLRSVLELVAPGIAGRIRDPVALGTRNEGWINRNGIGDAPSTLSADEIRRVVAVIAELGPTVAPGVRRMSGEFAARFTARLAERTREDWANPSEPVGGSRGGSLEGDSRVALDPAALFSALGGFAERNAGRK